MTHQFNTEIAEDLGINAAVLYQNMIFWCLKNKANNTNHYNDNYWTYNSVRAWKELFPYLGESAIKTALKKLEDEEYIKVGNYNKSSYDRTKWYSIIHLVKIANELGDNSQTIPDNKPDNKLIYIIIEHLNKELSKNYKATTKNKSLINSRLSEGFTLEDFKYVIKLKSDEWGEDEKMSKYLRPETLFGNKFESYLNQIDSNSSDWSRYARA